jgi:hypothetical protein
MPQPTPFPFLSDIVALNNLPEPLHFLEGGLMTLFSKIKYRQLELSKSPGGASLHCSIKILTDDKLSLAIPGTGGMSLVFNYDAVNGSTSISLTLSRIWEIRKYISGFQTEGFSYMPDAFFNILLSILDIDKETFIQEVLKVFYVNDSTSFNSLYQALSDPALNLNLPSGFTSVGDLIQFADLHNIDLFNPVFKKIIDVANNHDAVWNNIKALFKKWLGDFSIKDLEDLLIPKINVSVEALTVSLIFPRDYLIPSNAAGEESTGNASIDFSFGGVEFDTTAGFAFHTQLSASLIPVYGAFIGKTGFKIQITGVKPDFSRTSNIPEAEADGRPSDFIGAYITEAAITLPEKWFAQDNGTTLGIFGRNLLIGTGGLSGDIELGAIATRVATLSVEMTLVSSQVIKFIKIGSSVQIGDQVIYKTDATPLSDGLFEFQNNGGKIKVKAGKLINFVPPNPEMAFVLGKKNGSNPRKGFVIGFSKFEMEFQQNQLLHSDIKGSLTIPKFKQYDKASNTVNSTDPLTIKIEAYFAQDGDWSIAAKPNPNPSPGQQKGLCAAFGNIFVLTIFDLEVGRDDERVYLKTTSEVSFENNDKLKSVLKSPLKLKDFYIYSDGSFELKGGSIPLPESLVLPLGPVSITVTAIHFGAHQQQFDNQLRQYKYFGFDGGISVDPGGVDARGEGVKFYFTVDDGPGKLHDSFMRIDGIGIDITIPGTASKEDATLILSGYLSLKKEEYKGSIKFQLPQAGIAGGAAMAYTPKIPAFIVTASLDLSSPMPLANTGLGIYGFRALFGLRYIADKSKAGNAANWYEWYKAPVKGSQDVNKYCQPTDPNTKTSGTPFSIGAGISLATLPDDGRAFSSQLMLLLSIPNLYLLEGKANVLGKRVVEGDEPPFYAMLSFSPGDSIELGVGVDYLMSRTGDKTGQIARLRADIHAAYFFKDSKAWFVHIGTKDKPVTAEFLSFMQGYCYLMLSASGIEAGAGVHYLKSESYLKNTVKAEIEAYFDVWGRISFPQSQKGNRQEKTQIGGGVAVGGSVSVSVLGFGFYLGIDTILTAEAPKPFRVAGSIELTVGVKLVVKKIEKTFTVEFVWEKDTTVDLDEIMALPPLISGQTIPGAGVHISSGKTYPIKYIGESGSAPLPTDSNHFPAFPSGNFTEMEQLKDYFVVPLDTYIDLQFEKAVLPDEVKGKIGGLTNAPSDYEDLVPPVKGDRQVSHRYRIKDISIQISSNGSSWNAYHPYEAIVPAVERPNVDDFKLGYWQKTGSEYNKLRLLAQTPFSYMQQGQPGWYVPERSGMTAATLYCQGTARSETCVGWTRQAYYKPGVIYPNNGLSFRVNGAGAKCVTTLTLNHPGTLEIFLPEPCAMARIQLLSTMAYRVSVHFYEEVRDTVTLVLQGYNLIETVTYLRNVLPKTIESKLSIHNKKIAKIVVEPSACDSMKIRYLESMIDAQKFEIYKTAAAPSSEIVKNLTALEAELIVIKAKCCVRLLTAEEKRKLELYKIGLGRQLAEGQAKQPVLDQEVAVKCKIKGGSILASMACNLARTSADLNRNQCNDWAEQLEILEYLLKVTDIEPDQACVTVVGNVCWLTERDYYYNLNIPGQTVIDEDYKQMKDALKYEKAPIWRPNSKYLITLKVSDTVNGIEKAPRSFYFGFQTLGPLGYFPKASPATPPGPTNMIPNEHDMPEYMLKYYIDFDKSYPNADGRILYAKPLYYTSPVLNVFFKEKYTIQFFEKWESYHTLGLLEYKLEIVVKDPLEGIGNTANPNAPDAQLTLQLPPATPLPGVTYSEPPVDVLILNNLVQIPPNCIQVSGGLLLEPKKKSIVFTPGNLKPLKLYTAVVHNKKITGTVELAEVHRYNFQTSRYASFKDHIQSYRMVDPQDNTIVKEAKFTIHVPLNATQLADAWKVFLGQLLVPAANAPDLEAIYPDPFDRIVYGVWKAAPQAPPVSTEFNWIKPSKTRPIAALWIRSPEPFNDPKMPAVDLIKTVKILVSNVAEPAFKTVFSKDGTQVLIMQSSLQINPAHMKVQFEYWLWDGWKYAPIVDANINPQTVAI